MYLVQTPLVNAQSGRWGIVVNETSKSCARFWEGNSCSKVLVPKDWQAFLPTWNEAKQSLVLSYKDKTCLLGASTTEQCCAEFGLTFDKTFQAPVEKTARSDDPRSECFQLPKALEIPRKP